MARKFVVAGILILVLLVLCVGIGVISFVSFRSVSGSGISLFNARPFTVSVEETEQKNFPIKGEASLDLTNLWGDITIKAGQVSEIQVTAKKTAWGADEAGARQAMQNLVLTMTQDENRVTIRVEEQDKVGINIQNQANTVDFEIVVPAQTTVQASTRSGDVSLTGTQGKAVLDSDFGSVDVFDFKGGLSATSSSGKVSARRIQLLDTGFGDVALHSNFGDVTLEEVVTQKVDASSRSGAVELTNVSADGEVKLGSDFGTISYRTGKAGTLTAETRSGAVELEDLSVSGLVTAKSQFGDINLVQVNTLSSDLDTNSGSVTVNGASGSLKARSGFGNIEIEGGDQVSLDLETKNGGISYIGTLGNGPHTLSTDFGDIKLTLPESTAFDFDLQTDFGSIDSEFQVNISGEPDEKHWVGQVNGGGSSLTASTRNGSVELVIGQ